MQTCRTGWDVFSLRYALEEPLATVLPDAAKARLQAVSRLLWALKRGEAALNQAWRLLCACQRGLGRLAAASKATGLAAPGA